MGQRKSKIGQNTIAKQVKDYVERRPIIKSALQMGIVNYSALVRKMQKELGLEKSFEALLIAVRRSAERLRKTRVQTSEKIKNVLSASDIGIKTKMAVLILENNQRVRSAVQRITKDAGRIIAIEGSTAISVVLEEDRISELKTVQADILRTNKDQIEIIIKSPEEIEDVPGVVAFLTGAFAERGINIQEVLSFYRETILLFDRKDMGRVVEVLNELTK